YIDRGSCYKLNGNVDLAIEDFNYAIKLNPNDILAYNERSLLYIKTEQYDKAEKDFEKAIKLNPEDRTAYYHRAKMYIKQSNFDAAEKDYLKTIEMDVKDPEGFYYLAIMYETQNRSFEAVANYTSAISKLEADLDYYISDENGDALPFCEVFEKRASLYKKVNAVGLMCEDYQKALKVADNKEDKKRIEALINLNCKK
ncbi:MAG: tetratricopeptide repeat protein, partial [Flavobacteriales bacterium]|nr:tetratricopeptide repeat protein [Flavobacteriales bacterium]